MGGSGVGTDRMRYVPGGGLMKSTASIYFISFQHVLPIESRPIVEHVELGIQQIYAAKARDKPAHKLPREQIQSA